MATLTLFAQANSDHLHEALKQMNENNITGQNNEAIENLLKQCEHNTEKKVQENKNDMKWGAGETIGGIIGLYLAVKKIHHKDGAPRLTRSAIEHLKHNKEYTHDIETIEKALEAIKAKKENDIASQSNIEETL